MRKSGACIGADALAYTPEGPRKLTKLVPGDLIYSFDDYTLAERRIVEVSPRGMKPVFRVTLEDGRGLLATGDQLMVKVVDPRFGLRWAPRWFVWQPVSEFRAGDMVIAARASPEAIEQRPLIDDEVARFLGYRDASLAEYAINPFFDETYTELLSIKSLEPAGEAEVYEVAVELDESFVASGLVLL